MGNWRFGAFPKLPYSTMQQLNLDWILDRIRRFLPDTGTKGQVLTRTKDGAAWVDPEAASGAVSSVNGKTGAVVLTASDVGALPSSYQAPVTSVNGMTGDVVISGGGAVDSVNGQTGEVVLTAADVGALPESYVPPAAPVQSVNGQTGAVQLSIPDSTSDLTNDSGFITAAQAAAAAPVQSVNGKTGAVVLDADDVGALPTVIVDDTYSTASAATFDKTYTVSGNGVIVVFASILSDTTEDYGTWQARIYHNSTCIMGEGTRFTTAYNQIFGASTSAPIQVSNGDTIRVFLYNTKGGRKDGYRRFLCFGGCSVS